MKNFQILVLFCLTSLMSAGFYDGSSPVQKLDSSNFKSLVLDSESLWFVEFYAPWCGHCQRLTPEWEKLARSLSSIVNVGAVDMTVDGQVGAPYNVQGFPTLRFFGADKQHPLDYSGSRSASDMLNYAIEQIKSVANDRLRGNAQPKKETPNTSGQQQQEQPQQPQHHGDEDVIVLTDDNFEETVFKSDDVWLIEFYAPWCGHCKNLEPHWNELAKKVKGSVKIAKLDATANSRTASRFSVGGYPTIKFFPPGRKTDSAVEDYTGSRDSTSMSNWVLEKKEMTQQLELEQLINAETFKKYCKEAKAACIIVFLPHIYDSNKDERNNYIKIIEEVQISNKGKPLTFLWSQAGDHFQLEDQLGLGSGYPAVATISFRKTVFSVMRGSFSKESLIGFTNNIIAGKESFRPFQELPSIKPVEKWDGEDKKHESDEEIIAETDVAHEKHESEPEIAQDREL